MKNAKRGRGCLANTVALQQIRGIGVPPMKPHHGRDGHATESTSIEPAPHAAGSPSSRDPTFSPKCCRNKFFKILRCHSTRVLVGGPR